MAFIHLLNDSIFCYQVIRYHQPARAAIGTHVAGCRRRARSQFSAIAAANPSDI
jgi:hypothetical protein